MDAHTHNTDNLDAHFHDSLPQIQMQTRVASILKRIESAALKVGRNPTSIQCVAVSKMHPAEAIMEAMKLGLSLFGESRAQEALPKMKGITPMPEWHFIGHLQTNKVADVVGNFSLIHSVDSIRLIHALNQQAIKQGVIQKILLQVNISGESSKSGVTPENLRQLLKALETSSNLISEGLMTIPPFDLSPESARPYFRELRNLMVSLPQSNQFTPKHLSMGMSGDFEVAIEEGATLVRIGSAIFGDRT